MDSLFILRGLDQGRSFKLIDAVTTLGRDERNIVSLRDREVSRFHADIVESNGHFTIRDRQSSNGVFVNGQRVVNESPLVKGDRIQIGQTLLLFSTLSHNLRATLDSSSRRSGHVVVSDHEQSRILHVVKQSESEQPFRLSPSSSPLGSPAGLEMYLDLIYTMTRLVNETLDIDVLLNGILDLIFERFHVDRGCMLLNNEAGLLIPAASRTRRSDDRNESITISRTILDYVRLNVEGVLSTDAQADSRWNSSASVLQSNVREAICVPMKGRYGFVGVIYIDITRSPYRFPEGSGSMHGIGERVGPDRAASVVDLLAPDDSSEAGSDSARLSRVAPGISRLTADHLEVMVAIGHQAALAVEETRFHAGLVKSERMAAIGQTAAVVSHHIKNILQGIQGGSYMVGLGLDNQNETFLRKGWNIVSRNLDKISDLVLDMLTYSKERDPVFKVDNLNSAVREVVELMSARCVNRNITIRFYESPEPPMLAFDSGQIQRALMNLVTNAIDAVENKLLDMLDRLENELDSAERATGVHGVVGVDFSGRIEVRIPAVISGSEFVTVTVDDNGPGIPEDIVNTLFTPFVSKGKSGGTGLGLAVTNKIVQEHHGNIRVERSVLGGARFIVELPFSLDLLSPKRRTKQNNN